MVDFVTQRSSTRNDITTFDPHGFGSKRNPRGTTVSSMIAAAFTKRGHFTQIILTTRPLYPHKQGTGGYISQVNCGTLFSAIATRKRWGHEIHYSKSCILKVVSLNTNPHCQNSNAVCLNQSYVLLHVDPQLPNQMLYDRLLGFHRKRSLQFMERRVTAVVAGPEMVSLYHKKNP